MTYTPPTIEGDHVVITGPILGSVTLDDGRQIDVTAPVISVDSPETAAEVAHLIGQYWEAPENVHPAQINVDEDGAVSINDFVYDDAHWQAAQAPTDDSGDQPDDTKES